VRCENRPTTKGKKGVSPVGGIVGYSAGTVEDCVFAGQVTGLFYTSFYVGGLVGQNNGTMRRCVNMGSVDGYQYVGGVVGRSVDGLVEGCSNDAPVTCVLNGGGVVGLNSGNVKCCSNVGIVNCSGSGDLGGVIGWNAASGQTQKCRNSGQVIGGASSANIGGLVGYNQGILCNSVNSGQVTGHSSVGGCAGYNTGTVQYCYWKYDGTQGFNYAAAGSGAAVSCYSFTSAPGQLSGSVFDTTDLCEALNGWGMANIDDIPSLCRWAASESGYPALVDQSETRTADASVPHLWLDRTALKTYLVSQNVDTADYEAMANATGANGCKVWQSYVAGLDPSETNSHFEAQISFDSEGEPVVTYTPDLGSLRTYEVEGEESLSDAWGAKSERSRFFRVKVSVPQE